MIAVSKKTIKTFFVVVAVALLAAIVSFYFYKVNVKGSQRTFVFPSVEDGRFVIERRNLPKSYLTNIEYYVDEILLGPQTERTESLFPKGTKVLSCFERDKILYVNLSKDVINGGNNSFSIKDSIELFKKNIHNNFPSISSVEVYVEGNLAYEEN